MLRKVIRPGGSLGAAALRAGWVLLAAATLSNPVAAAEQTGRPADEPTPLRGRTLAFEFHASPFANLVYDLNVITGVTRGSGDAFREAWTDGGVLRPEDEPLLTRWRSLVERYPLFVEFAADEPNLPYPLGHGPGMDWKDKLAIAGYASATPAALRDRLALLVSPQDIPRFVEVVERFWPRFQRWFAAQGEAEASRFARGLRALAERQGMLGLTERMAEFYGSDVPRGQVLHFHVMFRPRTAEERSSGHVGTTASELENFAAVEVVDGESPADRIDVVMHELFHFLYWTRPLDRHLGEARAFAASGHPAAAGLYAILDEAVATAAGNGVVGKRVMTPTAFEKMLAGPGLYAEPFIRAMGAALLPTMEHVASEGGHLDDDFVRAYLALADRALGDDVRALHLLLRSRKLIVLQASETPWIMRFQQAFRGGSVGIHVGDGDWGLARYEHVSAVVMVRTESLGALEGRSPILDAERLRALTEASAGKRGVAFGIQRSVDTDLYVLAAVDDAAMAELIDLFNAARARFEGPGIVLAPPKG